MSINLYTLYGRVTPIKFAKVMSGCSLVTAIFTLKNGSYSCLTFCEQDQIERLVVYLRIKNIDVDYEMIDDNYKDERSYCDLFDNQVIYDPKCDSMEPFVPYEL